MDVERVTWIGSRGDPSDDAARAEAYEIRLGPGPGLPTDALERALGVVRPRPYVFTDSRGQTNWGATGLEAQEIEILFAIAAGAQVTATVLVEAFAAVFHALKGAKVPSAEAAWELFEDFLQRSFKVPTARLVSAKAEAGGGWKLVSEARGRRYEGQVSSDGRVLEAHRVELLPAGV